VPFVRRSLVVLACVVACTPADDALPPGTCAAAIWTIPARGGTTPEVIGEWSAWTDTESMRRFDDAWWVAELALPPGEYGYLVVEEGEAHLDAHNGLGGWRESDEVEVSWLVVDDCEVPRIEVARDERLRAVLHPAGVDVAAIEVEVDGDARPELAVANGATEIDLDVSASTRGRHVVELVARDEDGARGPVANAVLWQDPVAATDADAIVYHVMLDRFRGDGGEPLAPPPNPGARAGGTLDGVRAELERGTFDAFGVSTLWLSPVYVNPIEARPGRDDDHLYEGYHGYWPVDTRRVDDRLGGDAALDAVVATAHERGIRVVLDLVPNHYDETNPRVPGNGAWFNVRDPVCVCGAPDCPWSTEIETCWFTPYLPDVRLQHRDALGEAIADALWLHERFGVDGFRVDAVPMMPRAATRRIYHAVRRALAPADETLLLGEVFTGPGDGGIAALRYHVGPDGLDSVFDFPTMWALRDVLTARAGWDALVAVLEAEDDALDGSGVVLARMLGNHDTTRIASAITGDENRDPWTDPPPDDVDADALSRVRLGFAIVMTLPGMPILYYGDELGLAGARDPDSRRVMPDPAATGADALALQSDVARLGTLRRCMPTLRRGAWRSLGATADHVAFVRELEGDAPVLVVASTADGATTLTVPAAVPVGWYKDAMSDARVQIGASGADIDLPPVGVRVLVPEDHPCA
jgi:glycosidase